MTFKRDTSVPRVEVPGLTDEERASIDSLHEEMEWYQRTKRGFLLALFMKNPRPFTGIRKPARKPTKHQRHMARVAARSAYLKTKEA